jgi:uncharacterized cupredoxin-like copper-binding protein
MRVFRSLFRVGAVVAVAALLAACGGGGPANLSIAATDFAFTPSEVSVAAGQELSLTLTNNGSVTHEWAIMEQGYQVTTPFDADDQPHVFWSAQVEPGESSTFSFSAPAAAGSYPIVCGIAGHIEAGMVGTLTVTE